MRMSQTGSLFVSTHARTIALNNETVASEEKYFSLKNRRVAIPLFIVLPFRANKIVGVPTINC